MRPFAANLRRLRPAKGISQEDLAYEAGINRTYLSKLEARDLRGNQPETHMETLG